MRIANLSVKGFRSLANVRWNPGDLNLLIGPNAGGKSNLLHVLEMLSASARGELEEYVRQQGGMEPLAWDGSAEPIGVSVIWTDNDSLYELELARLGMSSGYRIGREVLALSGTKVLKILERTPARAVVLDGTGIAQSEFVAPEGSISDVETFLSVASGPFAKNELVRETQQELSSWAIYQDLSTSRNSVIRQPAIASLSRRVEPDAQNLISVLHTLYSSERDFETDVDAAMSAAFGEEYEKLVFPPDADQRIQLRVRWKSLRRAQSAADLSDGTLRFLFLLAALGNPHPPPVIAIDEPDIGLHPGMLPIVAEYATIAAERTQVILTTHSPAFLDAFRESTPAITVVESLAGRTNLRVLSGEKLAYWLKEYTLGEIYRTGELEAMEK